MRPVPDTVASPFWVPVLAATFSENIYITTGRIAMWWKEREREATVKHLYPGTFLSPREIHQVTSVTQKTPKVRSSLKKGFDNVPARETWNQSSSIRTSEQVPGPSAPFDALVFPFRWIILFCHTLICHLRPLKLTGLFVFPFSGWQGDWPMAGFLASAKLQGNYPLRNSWRAFLFLKVMINRSAGKARRKGFHFCH